MKWQPIETAPKRTPILATDGKVIVVLERGVFERGECAGKSWPDAVGFSGLEWEWDFKWEDLTHWMPLPELPPSRKLPDVLYGPRPPGKLSGLTHEKDDLNPKELAEALRRLLDALYNETHGKQETPWIAEALRKARILLARLIAGLERPRT